ncbi:MAG: long-chain fatty acid--CoA ligase [Saprospiraceae bacterium]
MDNMGNRLIPQPDWSAKWAVYQQNKIAFKEGETGRTLTYGQLNQKGMALAVHLVENYGLRKGDRIAVLAENCLEYCLLFAAAQKGGFILVPLNYRLTSSEIDYLISNAGPKILIWEDKFDALVSKSNQKAVIPNLWKLEALEAFCSEEFPEADFENAPIFEDDPIFILYTSGTTGFPKGAIYSHKMLFWNSINTAMSLIINSDSRTINCMPPFHTGGWNVLTTPFWHHGGYTCFTKKFEPGLVLKLIEQEKATIFMGVPTILKMLAEHPDFEKTNYDSLLYFIVGGESMPIPLIQTWHQKNVFVRQGYGMTEVGPNLTSLHQDDAIRKIGSIGRSNYYVDTKIVRADGSLCEVNEPGELLLRGPMVTPGYWNHPEATAKAMDGEWFKTGDMVRQDEEGMIYVVDRIKNMFISGGENVYPAEIERVLQSHPCVRQAAVIGVADDKWGEVGKAFIELKPGFPCEKDDISAYAREHLAKFKVPKYFEIIDELPRNDTGKINRKELEVR